MSYNPYDAVNRIFNLKGEWDDATNAGDANRAAKAAQAAETFYKQLRNNQFGDVADELAGKNYEQSKFTKDYYAKTGNTEFRPYMYSLGSKYGLSNVDVDKLINWDGTTGEIAFGGKKIGSPFAVMDGSSYFQDTSVLDSAFNEYAERTGLVRPTSSMVNQENEGLFKKYNEEYDYLKNTNPFETETGRSILERYDLKGLQGRDNEAASGAASNSGNIDSFSAANALRQQASLRNMGEQTALSAHQQRLQNAQTLLSQMGVNINNVFTQDQTAQNNQVARDTQGIQNDLSIAETFGQATSNQYTNPYIGRNMDFKAAYDQATESGASAEVLNQLAEARFMKQVDMNDFSAGIIPFEPTSKETANKFLALEQIKSAKEISIAGNDTSKAIASSNNQNALDQIKAQTEGKKEVLAEEAKYNNSPKPSLTAAQARDAYNKGVRTQTVIDAYNYWFGTEHVQGQESTDPYISDESADKWIKYFNDYAKKNYDNVAIEKTGANSYRVAPGYEEMVIYDIAKDSSLTTNEKTALYAKFGISPARIDDVIQDSHYR